MKLLFRMFMFVQVVVVHIFSVGILCFLLSSSRMVEMPNYENFLTEEPQEQEVLSVFERTEILTGVPSYILEGLAFAESSFRQFALGDDGNSKGMFQINEYYREERLQKFGYYDPYNVEDSCYVAGMILSENYKKLGDWGLAVASYRQGVYGVKSNGASMWYVNRVLNYSS
ncbi:MAG: transglycosylase SLT domain-containing protein [Bacteroidales bacterium]